MYVRGGPGRHSPAVSVRMFAISRYPTHPCRTSHPRRARACVRLTGNAHCGAVGPYFPIASAGVFTFPPSIPGVNLSRCARDDSSSPVLCSIPVFSPSRLVTHDHDQSCPGSRSDVTRRQGCAYTPCCQGCAFPAPRSCIGVVRTITPIGPLCPRILTLPGVSGCLPGIVGFGYPRRGAPISQGGPA
jgi:hypothetical protein